MYLFRVQPFLENCAPCTIATYILAARSLTTSALGDKQVPEQNILNKLAIFLELKSEPER